VGEGGKGAEGLKKKKHFKGKGRKEIEMKCEEEGNKQNHHPERGKPNNRKEMAKREVAEKTEQGMAFDGDGDRLGLIDDNEKLIIFFFPLKLFALDLLENDDVVNLIFYFNCSSKLTELIEENG
jgi:Phosphomannomutase